MTGERTIDGRWTVGIIAIIAVVTLGYFALGMPGMDHTQAPGGAMPGMDHRALAIDVDQFSTALDQGQAFVINVHTPVEASIEGTDLAVASAEVVDDPRLPADKATPILVYCKTGAMSAAASTSLLAAGYTDVRSLDGGTDAWAAAGRPLALANS